MNAGSAQRLELAEGVAVSDQPDRIPLGRERLARAHWTAWPGLA